MGNSAVADLHGGLGAGDLHRRRFAEEVRQHVDQAEHHRDRNDDVFPDRIPVHGSKPWFGCATAAGLPAPAAVVSTQDTRLSEDAGSVRYGCVHVENLLPDFCKRKSSPSILESEPCKAKMVTVSVEFRR